MTTKPKKRLHDMKIGEISVVDKGANGHADMAIIKRAAQGDADLSPTDNQEEDTMSDAYAYEEEHVDDAFEADGEEGGYEGDDGEPKGLLVMTEEGPVLLSVEDLADIEDVADLVESALEDDDADEGVAKIAKALSVLDLALASATFATGEMFTAADAIAKRDVQIAEYEGQIRKMGAEPIAKAAEAINLAELPEEVVRKLREHDDIAKDFAKMLAEKERAEFVAKARELNIGDADQVGSLLLRIAKRMTRPEDVDLVSGILRNAGNIQKNAELFAKFGDSGGEANTIETRLAAKVHEIKKRAGGENLTVEQAKAAAYREDPDLYAEYQRSRAVR